MLGAALLLVMLACLTVPLLPPSPAQAAVCATVSHGSAGAIVTQIDCYDASSDSAGESGTSRYVTYAWRPVCMGVPPQEPPAPDQLCTLQISPCEYGAQFRRLWGAVDLATGRRWVFLGTHCLGEGAAITDTVSDEMVLSAVRRDGLPRLRVDVQPAETTLVNLPTVLSTQASPYRARFTLLGQDVEVTANPTSFRWEHGDGTSQRTNRPGQPYPSRQVTHTYTEVADQLELVVTVTWTARVRVNGGEWRTLAEPILTQGPATTLTVAEAVPVLSAVR